MYHIDANNLNLYNIYGQKYMWKIPSESFDFWIRQSVSLQRQFSWHFILTTCDLFVLFLICIFFFKLVMTLPKIDILFVLQFFQKMITLWMFSVTVCNLQSASFITASITSIIVALIMCTLYQKILVDLILLFSSFGGKYKRKAKSLILHK